MALKSDKNIKYTLIVPVVAFILCIAIFPLFFSLYMSFAQWQPGAGGLQFVGLKNFKAIFNDERFIHALWLSFAYVSALLFIELSLGTFIAMLLQRDLKVKKFYRVAYMLPMLLTPIAVSSVWKMIYNVHRGPANYFLGWFGIEPVSWLTGNVMAFISLIIVDVWQWTPFMILTILAAFESIPEELFEAAVVDGGTPLKIFTRIAIPVALPIIITVVLLRTLDALKIFDAIYVLTGGGPGTATEMLNFYIFLRGFRAFDLGYGSAMSWIQLIIIMIMFFFFVKSLKRVGVLR